MNKKDDTELVWSRDDSRSLDELTGHDGKHIASIQPNMSARETWDGYNVTLEPINDGEHSKTAWYKEHSEAKEKAYSHGKSYTASVKHEQSQKLDKDMDKFVEMAKDDFDVKGANGKAIQNFVEGYNRSGKYNATELEQMANDRFEAKFGMSPDKYHDQKSEFDKKVDDLIERAEAGEFEKPDQQERDKENER